MFIIKKFKKGLAFSLAFVFTISIATASYMPETLVPIGQTTGIKMLADGAIVVSVTEVNGESSPAKEAGIEAGDVIISINSEKISSNSDLQNAITSEVPLEVTLIRGEEELEYTITPVLCEKDNKYKIGIMVRDSMAGIGTITFYDPETNLFAALGHGINDVDSGLLMSLSSGEIVASSIDDVVAGEPGEPGELVGSFENETVLGEIYTNTETGIYGSLSDPDYFSNSEALELMASSEVSTGTAYILSNISGKETQMFEIEIKSINYNDNNRDMEIKIVDPDLISVTGGIVQGMSGSPIIQDGKLVGAVTHVFVNDPTKGYGIFIENMLETAESINS